MSIGGREFCNSSNITALVVDSDVDRRRAVTAHLESAHSIRTVEAVDVRGALDRLADAPDEPDCVVAELELADASALSLLAEVRRTHPELPFVLSLDAGREADVCEAVSLGVTEYRVRSDDAAHLGGLALRIRTAVERTRTERRGHQSGPPPVDASKYTALFENVGDAIVEYEFVDDVPVVRHVNPAFVSTFGFEPRAVVGRSLDAFFAPSDRRSTAVEISDRVRDGEVVESEVRRRTAHGERDFHLKQVRLDTADDRVRGYAVYVDITERMERERALRGFRQAVERAGHAIIITDTDGHIEYVNPAFERITGYSREEAVGRRPSLVSSGHQTDAFYETLWETILAGEVWQGEIVNERKDGTQYYIEQTIAPIADEHGDVERFVAINNDITSLKEYEAKLERQNERLEEFGRTVAHDLRNPVNVLEGYLDLATADYGAEPHFEHMANALDRMETLIDDLLDLAKQGRSVVSPKPTSLADLAEAAWEHVDTADATLVVEGDATLFSDESRMQELVANLFRNSVEHGSTNPDSRVHQDAVEHGSTNPDSQARRDAVEHGTAADRSNPGGSVTVRVGVLPDHAGVYVEDDGPGIPPEERDSVLQSGFTTSADGTGFGLAIVEQIATAHGWEITVTEAATGGARFEFTGVEFDD